MKIGNIQCAALACADDISINSTNLEKAQILLNIAYDYSCKEHYKLQPQQSVVIYMSSQKKRGKSTPIQLQLNGTNLPNVEKTAHLGIKRSKTDKDTIENTVNENITKARITAYSLMSAGFHGNNGLDPSICIHIMKTYVIPTLLYGVEVITADKKNLEKLEKFHKRMVKQILSLPQNAPDIVPYIISGIIPIEGQIHIKVLTFLYSICLLPNTSTENKIAKRQISVKSGQSNSWFIYAKKIIWKYNLPEIYLLLEAPYAKAEWKKLTYEKVYQYW
jgi:hypothetical protein